MKRKNGILVAICLSLITISQLVYTQDKEAATAAVTYQVVDTGQSKCYNANGQVVSAPAKGSSLHGQDAQYSGRQMAYRDNGDGTVTDLNTGLTWQQTPDSQVYSWNDAKKYAENLQLGGYSDWRLPTIKELYSIAAFWGSMRSRTPYIDTKYFDFEYPDTIPIAGARDMDGQYWTSNKYLGKVMFGQEGVFGFNFADGRIKVYPISGRDGGKKNFIRCVRGRTNYGVNKFVDNGDGTITDLATGLMWMKSDSGSTINWVEALEYAESLDYANYSDWRLPNAKELQSIVDYSKAPDAANEADRAAAIDSIFNLTEMESWFWTNTTLGDNPSSGIYIAFGQAFSALMFEGKQMNAHGAGAQRSDPKTGNPADYPDGRGPQSDEIRIYNYVRCVRDADTSSSDAGGDLACAKTKVSSNKVESGKKITIKSLVKNKSDASSVSTTISFYLSAKRDTLEGAELLGTKVVPVLSPGKKTWLKFRKAINADEGRFFVVSYVDEPDSKQDINKNNNVSSRKIMVYSN